MMVLNILLLYEPDTMIGVNFYPKAHAIKQLHTTEKLRPNNCFLQAWLNCR